MSSGSDSAQVAAAAGVPVLETRQVSKRFGRVQALRNVNLALLEGQVLAVVGENGAGKSTLIKILSGAHRADSGEILMNGEHIDLATPVDAEHRGVVTVYQELNLFPALSVAENLLFGHYPKRGSFVNWRKLRQEAEHFLASLGVHVPVDKPVSSLSIAHQQLLEIAKALHRKARVLILDEPTAVLGGEDADALMEIVRTLKDHGVAVIFISHRLSEIFGLADRYLVLKDGVQVDEGPISQTDHDDLVAKMVGRELLGLSHRPAPQEDKRELLRVKNLRRAGTFRDIGFSLHAGEVLGVAGLRGAGRTEVVRAIFGLDPIDEGQIFVRGKEVTISSPNAAVELGMGLVPEDRKTQGLLLNLSVAQNVALASVGSRPPLKPIVPLNERRAAREYVQSLGIRLDDVRQPVKDLSGGNQQKVVIAKWLEAGSSILLLDEPTRGVDVGSKREIYEIIRKLCDAGAGVILVSSELPEVLEMSDRILVMHQGQIGAIIDRKDASEQAIMRHAVGAQSHLHLSDETEDVLTENAVGA
jgi:ABC-type sugar transport system ATPase subunit